MSWRLEAVADGARWDAFVQSRAAYSITQAFAWGELKGAFGWRPRRYLLFEGDRALAGVQVLGKPVPLLGGELWYAPRGFLTNYADAAALTALTAAIKEEARRAYAATLLLEPMVPAAADLSVLRQLGYRETPRHVQPLTTLGLDLGRSEEDLLAGMERRTRYNVNLAARKGVAVRASTSPEDLRIFHELLADTTDRKHFLVHNLPYYEKTLALFGATSTLLFAEHEGDLLAAAFILGFGRYAYYAHAASAAIKRELKAANLLVWEAIRWAKGRSFAAFDFWGIPREPHEDNPLYGVYTFKKGYGGEVVAYAPAYEFTFAPVRARLIAAGLAAQTALRNLRARGTIHDPMAG